MPALRAWDRTRRYGDPPDLHTGSTVRARGAGRNKVSPLRCRRWCGRSVAVICPPEATWAAAGVEGVMKVGIVGASGKLGRYMVQHALDRGYEVASVCREQSVANLDAFAGRMTVIPEATDDREVIREAVAGCGGVL